MRPENVFFSFDFSGTDPQIGLLWSFGMPCKGPLPQGVALADPTENTATAPSFFNLLGVSVERGSSGNVGGFRASKRATIYNELFTIIRDCTRNLFRRGIFENRRSCTT